MANDNESAQPLCGGFPVDVPDYSEPAATAEFSTDDRTYLEWLRKFQTGFAPDAPRFIARAISENAIIRTTTGLCHGWNLAGTIRSLEAREVLASLKAMAARS